MAQKWNLQDIRPAGTQKQPPRDVGVKVRPKLDIAPRSQPSEPAEYFNNDPDLSSIEVIDGNGAKRKRVILISIIAVVIISVGYFINILLGGAHVVVYPKTKDISAQIDITAYANPKIEELGYELLTLEATGEKQVKATGKETVSEQATGKIFVFNTKSTAPQRLIKNTRFESKDGLIFRIKESIEVPGTKTDAQGNLQAGKIVADVFSDGTGEKYNLTPQRFTVPGLKGSDQYENIYGESTAAFTGGFEGEKYMLDDNELSTAKQALHIELRDTLLARLKTERPAGFIAFDNSVAVSFETLPSTGYGDALATIKEKARLQVPLFKEDEFAKFLAEKSIPDYAKDPVTILDPLTLAFAYSSATTSVSDITGYPSLDFSLKGSAKIVWKFDENQLKKDLLGSKKTDSPTVFSKYPSISSAQSEIRPFWVSAFPDSPEKIEVETVLTRP